MRILVDHSFLGSTRKAALNSLGSPCLCLVFFWLLGPGQMLSGQEPGPFSARIQSVSGWNEVKLEDGRSLRLQGLSLPTPTVRPRGFAAELRSRLTELCEGREMQVVPERRKVLGEECELLGYLRGPGEAQSINELLLAEGKAIFNARSEEVRDLELLVRAGQAARRESRGWFGTLQRDELVDLPYLNGAVIGLHYQEQERDYHRQIDELQAAGFQQVSFLFAAFLADVKAWRIERDAQRSVSDERLLESIAYARSRGLRVMLLPILLLREQNDDDWRGTIRPQPEEKFWLEYDRFLSRYLDLAEMAGVDLFSIGSELGSMEDRRETWERLILNARARFSGFLTYSANWDHLETAEFFPKLDLVGCTGYFSLTEDSDPSREELRLAWRRVAAQLERARERFGRPLFITELGYCSQNGSNRDPWNYLMDKADLDFQEQADCFAAFIDVAEECESLSGAYFYDYFDLGGLQDHSYSPRGKPAMAQWRRWAELELPGRVKRARER